MCRLLTLMYFVFCLLAAAAPSWATPADPHAVSDAVVINFRFTLPSNITVQNRGGAIELCKTRGDAQCVPKVNEVNFGEMPKPDGFEYSILHEYAVQANAPPPNFSSAFFRLDSFFYFNNATDDDVFLPVNWSVTYNLTTEGVFSAASISIVYATEGPDNQGLHNIPLFAPVSVSNGGTQANELKGTLSLQLFPGTTKWRIEDPLRAVTAVSEPAASSLLLASLLSLGLVKALRRRRPKGGSK